MAYKKPDDYVEVADRLMEFYAKFPDGRITRDGQPAFVSLPNEAPPEKQKTFILYTAKAYRSPDDPVPAVGTAWEPWPGPNPYTKDSELMNAETSAWGRAIVAAGIPSKKIASVEEVKARTTPASEPKPSLEQVVSEDRLVEQVIEAFPGTTVEPILGRSFEELDLGQKAWVLKRATGLSITRDKTAINGALEKLGPTEALEAKRITKNLLAKQRAKQ